MGVNQDFGPYDLTIGIPENEIARIIDTYTASGVLIFAVKIEPILDSVGVRVLIDDTLTNTYTIAPGETSSQWEQSIEANQILTIEIFNTEVATLSFGEFEQMPVSSGLLINETFNGGFDELWDINTLGNDFSTVPGALYYSIYHDGGSVVTAILAKSFSPALDLLASEGNPVIMLNASTNDGALSVRIGNAWYILSIPSGEGGGYSFNPYSYVVSPPEGWDGTINAIGKRIYIEMY